MKNNYRVISEKHSTKLNIHEILFEILPCKRTIPLTLDDRSFYAFLHFPKIKFCVEYYIINNLFILNQANCAFINSDDKPYTLSFFSANIDVLTGRICMSRREGIQIKSLNDFINEIVCLFFNTSFNISNILFFNDWKNITQNNGQIDFLFDPNYEIKKGPFLYNGSIDKYICFRLNCPPVQPDVFYNCYFNVNDFSIFDKKNLIWKDLHCRKFVFDDDDVVVLYLDDQIDVTNSLSKVPEDLKYKIKKLILKSP